MQSTPGQEIRLDGLPVSPGVAIGRVFLIGLPTVVGGGSIKPAEIDAELELLREAAENLKEELVRSERDAGGPEKGIRRAHLLLLEDPSLLGEIERSIAEDQIDLPTSIQRIMDRYESRFESFAENLIRERALDIKDVCTQLLNVHIDRYQRSILTPEEPLIVAARDLLPSQTTKLDRSKVLGVISELGGVTSHTAILARSYGIPAVCGVPGLLSVLRPAATLAIDGTTGKVVVDPTEETLEAFRSRRDGYERERDAQSDVEAGPITTRDGTRVILMANVNRPNDMTGEYMKLAEGVGLFRTEYYFMTEKQLPSEEEQYLRYKEILEQSGGQEVIIRTLDAGGDKQLHYLQPGHEDNPMMGARSMRLCLQRPEIILPQIRAILRAAVHGDAKLMFPLVSTRSELEQAIELVARAREELTAEGVEHRPDVPIGLLVEVPAAALNLRNLLPLLDFVSVGTNDLTQYTMAVDRGNPAVAHLYQPLHPAVLRLLRIVTREARVAGKAVSMCGEMAGDPNTVPLLLGLGYRRLSVSPYLLPTLRRRVAQIDMASVRVLAARALKAGSNREIKRLLDEENRRITSP